MLRMAFSPRAAVVFQRGLQVAQIAHFVVDAVAALPGIDSVAKVAVQIAFVTLLLMQASENGEFDGELVAPFDGVDPVVLVHSANVSDGKFLVMRSVDMEKVRGGQYLPGRCFGSHPLAPSAYSYPSHLGLGNAYRAIS